MVLLSLNCPWKSQDIILYDGIRCTLTPGDDMQIDIQEAPEQSTFEGKGAEVNRYLSLRFYPKGGSYLGAGKYCFRKIVKKKNV